MLIRWWLMYLKFRRGNALNTVIPFWKYGRAATSETIRMSWEEKGGLSVSGMRSSSEQMEKQTCWQQAFFLLDYKLKSLISRLKSLTVKCHYVKFLYHQSHGSVSLLLLPPATAFSSGLPKDCSFHSGLVLWSTCSELCWQRVCFSGLSGSLKLIKTWWFLVFFVGFFSEKKNHAIRWKTFHLNK